MSRHGMASGTKVVLGLILAGIGLGVFALKYRRLMPRVPPPPPSTAPAATTRAAETWPAATPPASAPADGAADLVEQ